MIPLRIRDHAGSPRRLCPIRQPWHDRARGNHLNPEAATRLRSGIYSLVLTSGNIRMDMASVIWR